MFSHAAPTPPLRRRPAVFLDKDGTLVENVPYNADPALQRLMPGAAAALAELAGAGYALVVITNQSGLALGRFTLNQFIRLCTELKKELRVRAGVVLTDLLFCPHAPAADHRVACRCRKPEPWMLFEAARQHDLDLAQSWMIGDTVEDVEAGHRAGCRSVFFDAGPASPSAAGRREPELHSADWPAIARHLVASRSQALAAEAARALQA